MKAKSLSSGVAVLGLICGLGSAAVFAAEPEPQLEQQLEAARERLQEAVRDVGELSAQLGRTTQNFVLQRFGGPAPRAMLGVQVQKAEGGARVAAVSPGGPAEAAGIRQDDVITAVGGADVTGGDNPANTLVERMRELEPGLKTKVAVLRDGRKMEFDVTPREAPAPAFMGAVPGGRVMPMPGNQLTPAAPFSRLQARPFGSSETGRFRGMEFATLSERLGGYFGVKTGVLVVRAGEGGVFKLQDGDVILAIDGREPTSAAHATRILNSYQPGEKLTLRVQRDRRAQNIEVALPERERRGQRLDRAGAARAAADGRRG